MDKKIEDKDLENLSGGGDGSVFQPDPDGGGGGGGSSGGATVTPEQPGVGSEDPTKAEDPGGIGGGGGSGNLDG